jgi:ferredoxin
MTVRVLVDGEQCQGHARCNMVAPDLFQLRDDDGHAVVVTDPVPPGREEAARRAALGCPERAIAVIDGPDTATSSGESD